MLCDSLGHALSIIFAPVSWSATRSQWVRHLITASPFPLAFPAVPHGRRSLLPWRATSLRSIRRNLFCPWLHCGPPSLSCLRSRSAVERWRVRYGNFYALVAIPTAVAVLTAILSEFLRGAGVISRQTGRNLLSSTWLLTRRNTSLWRIHHPHRRGDHRDRSCRSGVQPQRGKRARAGRLNGHWSLHAGAGGAQPKIQCNYNSEYAMLDVYTNGEKQFEMTPEKRVYLASQQPQTMVAIHSVPSWDLYVVYEGNDPTPASPSSRRS